MVNLLLIVVVTDPLTTTPDTETLLNPGAVNVTE
jgi:hypothetical protein